MAYLINFHEITGLLMIKLLVPYLVRRINQITDE